MFLKDVTSVLQRGPAVRGCLAFREIPCAATGEHAELPGSGRGGGAGATPLQPADRDQRPSGRPDTAGQCSGNIHARSDGELTKWKTNRITMIS